MNETWLTILNEIINSETNEVNVEVKQYNKSMKLRVDKYHHYLRNYSKIDSIMGIMINLENILGYSVTEIQDDDSTTYIIKKDDIKNIKCNSNFLYDSNDIIPDRIDCEYTGYFNLKKTSATLQTIMFVTAGHKVCINISYITNKPFAIAEIDIDDHKRNILYEKISGVGKEIELAELKDLTDNELIIRKVTDLITIYTIYM
jgi:hypothetical protein